MGKGGDKDQEELGWVRVQTRPTYHQHQRLWWRSSGVAVETIVTHEGALVRNTDWNYHFHAMSAMVSAARTRPCFPKRMLTTHTNRVACLKWWSVCSFVHVDSTCTYTALYAKHVWFWGWLNFNYVYIILKTAQHKGHSLRIEWPPSVQDWYTVGHHFTLPEHAIESYHWLK